MKYLPIYNTNLTVANSKVSYLVESDPLTLSISEATKIATGIAVLFPFRYDYPSPALMLNVQMHKLKAVLEIMIDLAQPGHLLLPWLLAIGGVWSRDPERVWFIGHAIIVIDELDINSFEDYKSYCTKILWVDEICDPPLREFWEETIVKKTMQKQLDLDPW